MNATFEDDLRLLFNCIRDSRFGLSIYYSSFAIFVYDYFLTLSDEMRYMWPNKQISFNSVFFYLSRYAGFLCMLVVPIWVQPTPTSEQAANALRIVAIMSSEIILAIRTWAMWERSKRVAWGLAALAVVCVTSAAIFIGKDLKMVKYLPVSPNLSYIAECQNVGSGFAKSYFVPYAVTVLFEFVTFSLCILKVVLLRRDTGGMALPLAERLWRDGMLYFVCVLALSTINILLLAQSDSPQLRSGAGHFQAGLHSMIATRVVLHLKAMDRTEIQLDLPLADAAQADKLGSLRFHAPSSSTAST